MIAFRKRVEWPAHARRLYDAQRGCGLGAGVRAHIPGAHARGRHSREHASAWIRRLAHHELAGAARVFVGVGGKLGQKARRELFRNLLHAYAFPNSYREYLSKRLRERGAQRVF